MNISKAYPYDHAEWDADAKVWVAASSSVPGLVTEAETIELLVEKLKVLIPGLLELNGEGPATEVPFKLLLRRFEPATPISN